MALSRPLRPPSRSGLATPPPEPIIETISPDPDFSTATASTEPGSTVTPALLAAYARISTRSNRSSNNNASNKDHSRRHSGSTQPRRSNRCTTNDNSLAVRTRNPSKFTIVISDTWEEGRKRAAHCPVCRSPTLELPIPSTCTHANPEELRSWQVNCELTFYQKLLDDGAQPYYHRSLLKSITRHPEKFGAVIGYWQDEIPSFYCVFRQQWHRWASFRIWQRQMRAGYKYGWHLYIGRVCSRLKTIGYRGPRVVLHRNPAKQDMLATWVEYLCFEIARYEEVSWFRSPSVQWDMYDRYWQILLWNNVLDPHDARHWLETSQCKRHRDSKRKQAFDKIQDASSALLCAQRDELDPKLDDEGREGAKGVREKMETELETACDTHRKITQWDKAIEEYCIQTTEYRTTRREALKQEDYLRWVQFQIPHVRTRLRRSQGLAMKSSSVIGKGKRERVDEVEPDQVEPDPVINCRNPLHPAKRQCIVYVGNQTAWAPRPMRLSQAKCLRELRLTKF